MFRSLSVMVLGTMAMVLALGGCKSPSSMIKSPFSSAPDPHISSPAEMDELQLKAPPENYTKGGASEKKQVKSEKSYAQQGEYAVSPSHESSKGSKKDFPEQEIISSAASGVDTQPRETSPGFYFSNEEQSSEPVQMAMNPSAIQSSIPADSQYGYYGTGESSVSVPQTSAPQVFAPGSIGGY